MFTGLVQDVGVVTEAGFTGGSCRLKIRTCLPIARLSLGASVSCNGVCLTVVSLENSCVTFDVGPESLRLSRFAAVHIDDLVNLEPALCAGDSLGGHDVSGHIDETVVVSATGPWIDQVTGTSEDFFGLQLCIPLASHKYILPKGSVAVAGVSLTIARWKPPYLDIMIVPHTWQNTNLRMLKMGDKVEAEYDKSIKAIAHLLEQMLPLYLAAR